MKSLSDKYIIGAGPTGLISCFYVEDSIIFTDTIFGQQNNVLFKLGPRIIKDTKYTRKFCNRLGLKDIKSKEINVGYYDGCINDIPTKNLTEDFKRQYALKTRNINSDSDYYRSILSGGQNRFKVLDIDYDNLLVEVYKKVCDRIELDKITDIDLGVGEINFLSGNSYFYDEIISTIPLPSLLNICNFNFYPEIDFTTFNTKFLKVNYNDYIHLLEWKKNFDYIYSASTNWHRVSFFDDYAVFEFLSDCNIENFKFESMYNLKNAQIKHSRDDISMSEYKIKLLGRYSQWNHSIKLEQVIEYFERQIESGK